MPLATPRSQAVTVLPGMSHAPKILKSMSKVPVQRQLTQTDFGHWTLDPGHFWRSELESNQPFGLFRPALILLSYPTGIIADFWSAPAPTALWIATRHEDPLVQITPKRRPPDASRLPPHSKWQSAIDNQTRRRCRSRSTFSRTSRSSCTSMKRYLRHSALASA